MKPLASIAICDTEITRNDTISSADRDKKTLFPHLPRVVDQHGEGAETEDPESSEQLWPALHPEGTGIVEGQRRRETVGRLDHRRPAGHCPHQPHRWQMSRQQARTGAHHLRHRGICFLKAQSLKNK